MIRGVEGLGLEYIIRRIERLGLEYVEIRISIVN